MARVNVELKAHAADLDAIATRCAELGAEDLGVLNQQDTYFTARSARLKLREERDRGSELISWRRPDVATPTESTYVLAPVSAPGAMREALEHALGPPLVVVSKRRHVFIWEGVRIHLDEVDGLGTFIEFESVLDSGADAEAIAAGHEKLARLRSELEIEDSALVAVGYADLLMDGPQVLLRAAEVAMRNAYAPYSQFKVGAAVRGASGAIYAGANAENAAYPQSQCAEASALGALVAAGESEITAAAVVAERVEQCAPCGGCRQRLAEFADVDTPVYLGRPGARPKMVTVGELLPGSFGREALGR
jgi:homotetrameric cytidine deaminase